MQISDAVRQEHTVSDDDEDDNEEEPHGDQRAQCESKPIGARSKVTHRGKQEASGEKPDGT